MAWVDSEQMLASTDGGAGKKRARESPGPPDGEKANKKKQAKPSLTLTKPTASKPALPGMKLGKPPKASGGGRAGSPPAASAEQGIRLEEGAIRDYLQSRKVSMKEFLRAFDEAGKEALKSPDGARLCLDPSRCGLPCGSSHRSLPGFRSLLG